MPFTDLGLDEDLASDILDEFRRLIVSAAYVNGPAVEEFEAAFSAYCGSSYCVGVSSGLDALRLGLVAAGLEPGEEVVVPASTFVATAEAVTQAGGVPVLVDVSEADYGVDPGLSMPRRGLATRAVVPVHLYGQMADLTALGAVADRHHLTVIEDACQAHGAERDGRRAGSVGLAGAFSFYPAKNLGAFGDAGALVTDSRELADSARAMREHGQRKKYEHHVPGLHGASRHDPGDRADPQARPPGRGEPGAPERRPRYYSRRSTASATCGSHASRPGATPSGTCS